MAVRMPSTLASWNRERELSSDKRAGSWARGEARKRHWAFAKQNWAQLVAMPLATITLTPVTLLMPEWSRAFVAGALVTTGVAASVVLLLLKSGTAGLLMGESANNGPRRTCEDCVARAGSSSTTSS